jgi:glycosyltransferase involved in cell wall biosynthesis
MMKKQGFEVYHYGVETSDVDVTENVELLTKKEWYLLRQVSYQRMHPELTDIEVENKVNDKKTFYDDFAQIDTLIYEEFNRRLRTHLIKHYRSPTTDIVCLPYGKAHDSAIQDLNVLSIETGIGYHDSYQKYRVFVSYCHLHTTIALEKKYCQHYWFVIPNYFNSADWPLNLHPDKKKIGFFGRICDVKGCIIITEIAKCFPDIDFILCGQGDASPYMAKASNIIYKEPIHGLERGEYLKSLSVLLAPTIYAEPFGNVVVEAQLCGTPVITNDFGAFVENIEAFKTGYHCHTLADFCWAINMVLDDKLDRYYIRERAMRLYDVDVVAKKFEYTFRSVLEMYNGNNGWYSPNSFMDMLMDGKK